METKYCASCDTDKQVSEFHSDKSRKDGLYVSCKKCKAQHNKERQRQYQSRRRNENGVSEKQELRTQGLKRCRDCKKVKKLEEFHSTSSKGYKKPACKDCANTRWCTQKADRVDQIVHEIFGDWECQICGYNRCKRSFDFHHKETATKDFNVASRYTPSYDVLKKEISKCMLLCANCHREVHDGFITLGD